MSYLANVKNSWTLIQSQIFSDLQSDEELNLNLSAEETVFIRFNGAKVRQNTLVEQADLELKLQNKTQLISLSFSISGNAEEDLALTRQHLKALRQDLILLPEDPYIVPFVNNGTSKQEHSGELTTPDTALEQILEAAANTDFAGLYCAGPKLYANCNSKGQNHFFSNVSFFVDYSLYNGEKAVKDLYAGTIWDAQKLAEKIATSRSLLALMAKPKIKLQPGVYRTYLAPGALAEVATMFHWGTFSYSNYKRGGSALLKMLDAGEKLSPLVSVDEDFSTGINTIFNENGEVSEEKISLIAKGELKTLLISTRSAKEYEISGNKASGNEAPRSFRIHPGSLNPKDALSKLGTGIYLSNLHYLNWSDVKSGRITGMTRYACFWVEDGEIKGPIEDMRFDDTLYDILGTHLEALTTESEYCPDTSTYGQRSIGGYFAPGALLSGFKLTL